MRADELKQALKNGVYRSIGEAATGAGVVDEIAERTLCVLMYHKVNDTVGNTVTVPTSQFDEQMAQLRELDYTVVSLDDVLAHYLEGRPLPTQAVLITFDDAYLDNLENAVPILQQHGYPAVLFAPIGYLDGRRPLPHDEHLAGRGIVNRTLDWSQLAELESGGVRVESHGIGHRPLADRAFAYVKGSEAHYRPVHLSLLRQAGYDVAFTSISGGNGSHTDPLQLHRYNVEPYPPRTFELVLSGACDLIALKDTVAGTHARRLFNAALGTSSK